MTNQINIIFLGNMDSGKTTICSRLSNLQKQIQPTLGVQECKTRREYTIQGQTKSVDIKLIDTSGDPHYMDLIEPELLHTDSVVFVFALNNQQSYDDLNYWLELVQPFIDDYITLMIVGNKSEDKQITENVEQLAKTKGILYTEVSAQYRVGLENMLSKIVYSVLQKRKIMSSKKELKIQSSTILKLKQGKDTRTIRIGIIGDPGLGKFRIFSKACKQFNAKDTITPLSHGSLSQRAEIYFPNDQIIVQLLDITDNQLSSLLTSPTFQLPQIALIAFTTQSRKSFDNIQAYLGMFQDARVILIATRADSTKRQLSQQQFANFANGKNLKYFQLGEKNNQFIQTLFQYIIGSHPLQKNELTIQKESSMPVLVGYIQLNQLQKKRKQQKDSESESGSGLKFLIGLGGVAAIGVFIYYKLFRK